MFKKSNKLEHVRYDIRGPILEEVQRLEALGHSVTKLNIGNPAAFGFAAPQPIVSELSQELANSHGYSDFRGVGPVRDALAEHYTQLGIAGIHPDDIYTGNGVSELIVMCMQGLLNDGDEILVPAPDYPLWTAAVHLGGGRPVHYLCDEQSDWIPDLQDIENKITARTRAIVIINPNNPTGAVYPKEFLVELVKLARRHQIIVFSDEIYDTILYDGIEHVPTASISDDVFCITLSGLSKSHFLAGYRAGWMVLSGDKAAAKDYIDGLNMLASMRLCSNVPAQFSILTALSQRCTDAFRFPLEQLTRQRDAVYERLNSIPGISCTKPKGAFYAFPKIDTQRFGIADDRQFALDLLRDKKLLVVQGTGFNWPDVDHFRIVFLLNQPLLDQALTDIGDFFAHYHVDSDAAPLPLAAAVR